VKIGTQTTADRLGVSRRCILALIKTGQLPATWVAGVCPVANGRSTRDLKLVESVRAASADRKEIEINYLRRCTSMV
jgi:hypothetical protein